MGISRQELKSRAKLTIRETKPSPLMVALVYTAILILFNYLQNRLLGINNMTYEEYYALIERAVESGRYFHVLNERFDFSTQSVLLRMAVQIVTTIIGAGFSLYCLRISRGIQSGVGTLLDGFGMVWKIVCLFILQSIFIFLWTLLFVFPGIVAFYRYRQALYLLLDHPDWSAMECIRTSRQMMHGRKMELFVLDLSFILWTLLTGFNIIGIFISIWLHIYQELTFVNYYNAILDAPVSRRGAERAEDNWTSHE